MIEPLTVLFAIQRLDRSGPDRVIFELLRGLDRSRFVAKLVVLSPGGYYLSQLPADVEVFVLGDDTQPGLRARLDRYPLARALQLVHRLKPAVVMSTLRMNVTMGLGHRGFPRGTKLVIRQANDFTANFDQLLQSSRFKHRAAKWLTLRCFDAADAIVCQSQGMKEDLIKVMDNRSAGAKMTAISNPIDVVAARSNARNAISLPGSPALISVGRLTSQKGFDILLPALPRVIAVHPNLHLTVLGDGPDLAALQVQAAQLGVASHITFKGFSDDVLSYVKAADLFVLASRYEGFPNAALESLALGVPVVLTNCPGANRDIVIPGVNGRLASAVDSESFAIALLQALAEKTSYQPAAISTDTDQRYGIKGIVAQYQAVFDGVVASTTQQAAS
jgi:glycosyltransferase involved in cell wall biosynthesis